MKIGYSYIQHMPINWSTIMIQHLIRQSVDISTKLALARFSGGWHTDSKPVGGCILKLVVQIEIYWKFQFPHSTTSKIRPTIRALKVMPRGWAITLASHLRSLCAKQTFVQFFHICTYSGMWQPSGCFIQCVPMMLRYSPYAHLYTYLASHTRTFGGNGVVESAFV